MPNTLPFSGKAVLIVLQTALNRQLGADIFSVTDDGTHISLVVALPGKPPVKMSGLGTDADGIAGTLSLEGVSDAQPLNIAAFGGFDLALTGFELTVAHGRFTDANIRGRISLPFLRTRMVRAWRLILSCRRIRLVRSPFRQRRLSRCSPISRKS